MLIACFVYAHGHDDEEEAVFIPAADPGQAPSIIQRLAQGDGLGQAQELGFQSHGFVHGMAAMGGSLSTPWIARKRGEVNKKMAGKPIKTAVPMHGMG